MRRQGLRIGAAVATAMVAVIGADGCRAQGADAPLSSGSTAIGTARAGGGATGSTSRPQTIANSTKDANGTNGSSSGSASGVQPLGIPGNWRLVFDDEFNGGSLDTTHWSTGWLGGGITPGVNTSEEACYDPAQVAVADGTLDLSIVKKDEYCGGVTQPYAAAAINTDGKNSFLFGAFEARIYLPSTDGGLIADWPSWWANGQNWPVDGEMDIMEGLSGKACYHLRYTAAHSDGSCPAGLFTGWHTYAADWEPGSVAYYFDGVDVGQITNSGITPAPQFLVLNYSMNRGSHFNAAPATMRVDYVRVWQH